MSPLYVEHVGGGTEEAHPNVTAMCLAPGQSLRVLGTFRPVRWWQGPGVHRHYAGGMEGILCPKKLWHTKGLSAQKMRALHLSVFPVLTWSAGTRGWITAELRGLKTLQLRITRRECG